MTKLLSAFFRGYFGAAFVALALVSLLLPGAWVFWALAALLIAAVLPWHRRWLRDQAHHARWLRDHGLDDSR